MWISSFFQGACASLTLPVEFPAVPSAGHGRKVAQDSSEHVAGSLLGGLVFLEPGGFGLFETLKELCGHGFVALGIGGVVSRIFEFSGIRFKVVEFGLGMVEAGLDGAGADVGGIVLTDGFPEMAVEGIDRHGVFGFPGHVPDELGAALAQGAHGVPL